MQIARIGSQLAAVVVAGLVAGCGGGESAPSESAQARAELPPFNFEIRTLSNRADLVSDGNVLVEVDVPKNVPMHQVTLRLNGADVGSAFVSDATTRKMRGVLTGLAPGENVFVADANGNGKGRPWASLTVTNHARGGPVLLGSQTQPWVCATPTPVAQSGNTPGSNASGLTTFAVDAQCNIATEYKLFYRTTVAGCSTALPDPSGAPVPANNCFQPYTVGSSPANMAMTTTNTGITVPYIVRVERGTMNRGIYDIAVLFDPTKPWTALAPQPQWNGKVIYSFGASTGQPRLQNRSSQNWADNSALSRGFMVVDNSLNDSSRNSNRVLNAETLMMMKEHIVDNYGEIKYTLGNGCSGGSIGQNTAASIYPGLLDGMQPSCDYPDSVTTGLEVIDCVLLVNAYVKPQWMALMGGKTQAEINAKKTAINGHLDHLGCQSWNNAFGFNNKPGNYVPLLVVDQATGALAPVGAPRNNCSLPAALVYDPASNPAGTRCGDADLATAVWGTTPGPVAGATRALQTGDNIGIQYGLNALKSGAITAEEFVTLNEIIGGSDVDSNLVAQRTAADPAALSIAYRAGIVASGTNHGKLPIIDSRGYDEQGIHYIWRTFSQRDRIAQANGGNYGNQVIWRYGTALVPVGAAQTEAVTVQSLLTMDTWLSNLLVSAPKATLNSVRSQAQVIDARPSTAFDLCYLTGDVTFSNPVTNMALCDADPRLQKHESPRQVAGGSISENILKCQLKPMAAADYLPATLTGAQMARMQAVFPGGVCDWSKPGVGQQEAISPLTFAAGPGGQPLPPAPVSQGQ
jgi:hypothetical protein